LREPKRGREWVEERGCEKPNSLVFKMRLKGNHRRREWREEERGREEDTERERCVLMKGKY
jgi:hypothetical protein